MPVFSWGPPRVTADFFLAVWPGGLSHGRLGEGFLGFHRNCWSPFPVSQEPRMKHKSTTEKDSKSLVPQTLIRKAEVISSKWRTHNFFPKLHHLIPIEKIGSPNFHHNSPWLRSSWAHFGLPSLKHPVDYSCAPAVSGVWPENPQWLAMGSEYS